MTAMLEAPRQLIQSFADVRLPIKTDSRMQLLMSRNNEGLLSDTERDEFESLVELSESLSLLRANALLALGQHPK
jgi:hypothetical protein